MASRISTDLERSTELASLITELASPITELASLITELASLITELASLITEFSVTDCTNISCVRFAVDASERCGGRAQFTHASQEERRLAVQGLRLHCLEVSITVRTRNSKTIAPIDLIFLPKMYYARGSVL